MLNWHNDLRAKHEGTNPLTLDDGLIASAQAHANKNVF